MYQEKTRIILFYIMIKAHITITSNGITMLEYVWIKTTIWYSV